MENAAARRSVDKRALSFKVQHILLLAFFTFIAILHLGSIYLFTSGFLLTRLVLDNKTTCEEPPAPIHNAHRPGNVIDGCWHPKAFDKAVVLIIDALRYDFTIPSAQQNLTSKPLHYHDSIPLFYETAVTSPGHAVLLPFIADPPTTTLQRLKGLTTGTLPTFIDAGSNFAGTAIDEDNLVAKLQHAGKKIVHLGDDTWHSLFPGLFDVNLTRSYDSFNVWDLHTVDNGVTEHLIPLLHSTNSSQWDVIFGHFLGVDHAGHRYGPDHPAMTSKLRQMDATVRQIMSLIDDRTLLVVMGDHGMDAKGDHGGESNDEVEAAIWMYSKSERFGRASADARTPPPSARIRPVNQIDFVPTISLLLGLPIPFNNLGAPIVEAFIGPHGTNWQNLAAVNRLSSAQTRKYQEQYALVRRPDSDALRPAVEAWETAVTAWETKKESLSALSASEWQGLADAFSSYQTANLKMSKDLWARFDPLNMIFGIITSALLPLFLVIYAVGLSSVKVQLSTSFLARGSLALTAGSLTGLVIFYLLPSTGLLRSIVTAGSTAGLLTLFHGMWSARDAITSIIPGSLTGWLCLVPALLLSVGFASNSYTIWEDEILLFFIGLIGCVLLAKSLSIESAQARKTAIINSIVFTVFVRLASLSRLCREEQMPICRSTFYSSATSSTSAPWQLSVSYLVAFFLPSSIKSFYKRTQSYTGAATFWIGIVFQSCLFMIAAYWTLDAADDGGWLPQAPEGLLKTMRVYLARLILIIAVGAGTATYTTQTPFINVDSVNTPEKSTPKVTKSSKNSPSAPTIIIAGASNAYGAHFAILPLTILLIPLLLVQKPMGQGALSLTTIAMFSLIDTLHLLSPRVTSLHTRFAPVVLALLAHFAYFKTGHQATLSSIQWDVAFVPSHTVIYPWSPLMVILNTFGAQILCAATVPLCVLWRRPYRFAASSKPTLVRDVSGQEFTVLTPAPPIAGGDARESIVNENERKDAERRQLLSDVATAMAAHVLVYALINLATTVWAAHLRRHLMLYRIFSPRWMMGCAALLVAELVGVWIGLGGVRWSVGSVAGVFGW